MPLILKPEDLLTNSSAAYWLDVNGAYYDVQGAHQPYSIRSIQDGLRFELRDGDRHWWDVSVGHPTERNEIAGKQSFSDGVPLHLTYGFTLQPGAPNTATWMVIGQLHMTDVAGAPPYSPPFAIHMVGEKMAVTVRYSAPDGSEARQTIFTDVQDIQRGHRYAFDIKAVFDPDGGGRLVIARDGVVLADYSGPLGYQFQNAVYWAEGIYRDGGASETVVADYTGLRIETGDAVRFPAGNTFVAAPTIRVGSIAATTDSGASSAHLTGTTVANGLVSVFEGATKLGEAKADANGRFALDVLLNAGSSHLLSSYVTTLTGQQSILAKPVAIEVGTTAEILARLETIVDRGSVGAIVLTDTPVFHLSSVQQLWHVIRHDAEALSKIQGPYSFVVSTAVKGPGYDRMDVTYDAAGRQVEMIRYSAGTLVFDQIFASDGSSTVKSKNSAGGFDVMELSSGGAVRDLLKYDPHGALIFHQVNYVDGSKRIDNYDTKTGRETGYTIYSADGERTVVTLGIVGQTYTSQSLHYTKDGKLSEQVRFDGAGEKVWSQTWNADGGHADGRFGLKGVAYSGEVLVYNKAGVLIERERYDAGGKQVYEDVIRADGSHTTYTFRDGAKVGATVYNVDKSKIETTFFPDNEQLISSKLIYDTSGKLIEKDLFTSAGALASQEFWRADGTHKVVDFFAPRHDAKADAIAHGRVIVAERHTQDPTTHVETGFVLKFADGGRLEAGINIANKAYAEQYATYDASGKLAAMLRYYGDAGHHLALSETVNADGSREAHHFDVAGRQISSAYIAADGSRDLVSFSYGTASAMTAALVTTDHRGGDNVRHYVDVQTVDGKHTITTGARGVTVESHGQAQDTFISGGADTFSFKGHSGHDVIKNFQAVGAARDHIAIDHAIASDFDHLVIKSIGSDTVIQFSAGDSLTLTNVAASSLGHDTFLFI